MGVCFVVGLVIGIIVGCYGYYLITNEEEVEDGNDLEELSDQDLGELLIQVLSECQARIHEDKNANEQNPFEEFDGGKKP